MLIHFNCLSMSVFFRNVQSLCWSGKMQHHWRRDERMGQGLLRFLGSLPYFVATITSSSQNAMRVGSKSTTPGLDSLLQIWDVQRASSWSQRDCWRLSIKGQFRTAELSENSHFLSQMNRVVFWATVLQTAAKSKLPSYLQTKFCWVAETLSQSHTVLCRAANIGDCVISGTPECCSEKSTVERKSQVFTKVSWRGGGRECSSRRASRKQTRLLYLYSDKGRGRECVHVCMCLSVCLSVQVTEKPLI